VLSIVEDLGGTERPNQLEVASSGEGRDLGAQVPRELHAG
jgi:hypothetical protein